MLPLCTDVTKPPLQKPTTCYLFATEHQQRIYLVTKPRKYPERIECQICSNLFHSDRRGRVFPGRPPEAARLLPAGPRALLTRNANFPQICSSSSRFACSRPILADSQSRRLTTSIKSGAKHKTGSQKDGLQIVQPMMIA